MKRFFIALITFLVFCETAHANHTKGGWMYYEYLGQGIIDPSKLRYKIGLILYIDCNSTLIEPSWNFSFFNGASPYTFIQDIAVSASSPNSVSGCTTASCYPCISPVPDRCYKIITYETIVELTPTPDGYIISKQRCCRIAGINNLIAPSNQWGATYSIKIPGTNNGPTAPQNSSPKFIFNDTAVVCANNPFTLNFQANDLESDSLVYSFCSAYHGADQTTPNPGTAAPPPYGFVSYQAPYSGSSPLGLGVSINAQTGLITGIAPMTGEYVLCVCVSEYRNGVFIAETRKEIHLKTADCNPLGVQLSPKQTTCDGFVVNFQNDYPNNPPTTIYNWNFGDPASGLANTSTLPTPTHTFSSAGTFIVKLKVALPGNQCADSATFPVKVFPGFRPGFLDSGGCVNNPFKFFDTTATDYGVIDSWSWNFGDLSTLGDTSHIKNPLWTYATPGVKAVTLIVTNDKGCVDTAEVNIDVLAKPTITLAFNDALICIPDSITLNASGTGTFNWTPLVNIINANTPSPTVFPVVDTWYVAHLDDNGCVNVDSVHIRIAASVSLQARGDTTICLTDAVQLNVVTNATAFVWTPAATLNNPNIANPVATPVDPVTIYQVLATIGTCFANDEVIVRTIPYPTAALGPDEIVCFNKSAQLNATAVGNSFTWSPTKYLSDSTILNPIATPPRTTTYILTVRDNRGCPKPARDTIVVYVNPRIRAFAGRDTIVVVNQPLQFTGSGGVTYHWSPSTGLTNPNIYNPIGVYGLNIDSVKYKLVVTDGANCSDSAYVTVRVFKVKPTIFVPTAFTPNGDGLNDTVYPITVGIKKINYFSIYNRWGELVFTSNEDRRGWDGRLGGKLQSTAVFVWMVSAIDYLGKPIFLKGTVTLIR
jgi:gliding motility-associated-like protein